MERRYSGNRGRGWKKSSGHKNKSSSRGREGKSYGQQTSHSDPFEEGYVMPENFHSSDGGGSRHPPHLKGREIGMFYAKKAQEKQKAERAKENPMENTLILKLEDFEAIGIQEYLKGCTASLSSSSTGEDWKTKYACVNNSHFKEKFLDNLEGNDSTHFASAKESEMLSMPLPNSTLDHELKKDFETKSNNKDFQEMCQSRSKLPIASRCEEILKCVEENQVIVICGETGCGKTTQVGQFLLDNALKSNKGSTFHAICTQPRRIAAISVAQRVAQERCEPCGGQSSVGYQIRLERRLPRTKGSILFCTTGILIQFLQSDPYLENVSHLLLDEVHERDILTDFILTVVRDLLPKRPQLRVILMSATINSETFSNYFNGCPVLLIPGMTYPVENLYLEDILTRIDYRVRSKVPKRFRGRQDPKSLKLDIDYTQLIVPFIEDMETNRTFPYHVIKSLRMRESEDSPEDLLIALLKYICTNERNGAILVFLPGWEQISRLHKELLADRDFSGRKYLILPLHSMMPTVNQRQVFDRPPSGVRKIILATNIAETSLTIDDVVYVIDTGKIKLSNFDPNKNLNTLNSEWISLANGRQRQGRAGRTQAGICYRLYSRGRETSFAAHPVPEMKRMRLEELVLRVKILKLGQVEVFLRHVPEPPEEKTVQLSLELLRTLGALDDAECLTPLGFHLAQLPTDPRTGKLILMGAIFGCLDPLLSIAAALSFKDPFVLPLHQEEQARKAKKHLAEGTRSDHLLIARAVHKYRMLRQHDYSAAKNFCYTNFLSSNTMSMISDMADQFARDLFERKFIGSASITDATANINSNDDRLVRAVLCSALFPNIAKVFPLRRRPAHQEHGRSGPPPKIITAEDGRVNIHPRSVNYDTRDFKSQWLCYHGKVKTSSIFLHDCSEVSPLALIFFGGEQLKIKRVNTIRERIDLGRGLNLDCDPGTVVLMEMLRRRWDDFLSYRVSHPGQTDWSCASPDVTLLRAIALFITSDGNYSNKHLVLDEGYQFPRWKSVPKDQQQSNFDISDLDKSEDDTESTEDWEGLYSADEQSGDKDEEEENDLEPSKD